MRPKDPIEELHESRVFKRLKKICDDYAQRATRFVSEIAPVLAFSISALAGGLKRNPKSVRRDVLTLERVGVL